MAKTHYEDRKLSFDTLAIHVGQEKPDADLPDNLLCVQ